MPEEIGKELMRIGTKMVNKRKVAPPVKYEAIEDGTYSIRTGKESGAEDTARLMEALGLFDPAMLGGVVPMTASVSRALETVDIAGAANGGFERRLSSHISPVRHFLTEIAAFTPIQER